MSQLSTSPVAAPTAVRDRRWLALSVLALAQFLVVLDASIVNIALPAIGAGLGMDTSALAWVITAYVLPFGGLLLLGGRLADRFGHRTVFLTGVGGFIAASALAGFAPTGDVLLAARALQGASAALLAPAALALVTVLFPASGDRAKALGIWGAVAGIGSAAGVLLGGILTAAWGWGAVFFVNVPVGILVVVVIPALVRRDGARATGPIDMPGALTVTGGLTALVAALSQGGELGWTHPLVLAFGAAAVVLLVAFILIERRSAHPLVPFGIFRNRAVSVGNLAMLLVGGATTGLFFLLSVFMQQVLGYDALAAGLSQLPLALVLVVVAGTIPTVIVRFGVRATLAGSLAVLAAGLVWLSFAPTDASFALHLLGPSILIGAGLGAAFVGATQLAVHGVSDADAGLASGLVNTAQQVGGAVGLGALATVAAAQTGALSAAGAVEADALTGGFGLAFLGAALLAALAAAIVGLVRVEPSR